MPLIKNALGNLTDPNAISYGVRIVAECVNRSAELNYIAGQELGFNELTQQLYYKSLTGPYLTNMTV